MLIIRPIRPEEVTAARRVILTVGYNIFGWERGLEDMIRHFEATDEFEDMAHIEEHYFQNGGVFLAVLDDDKVIGSGAIRKFNSETAELKRLWLLDDYQGRQIGYQVIVQLFEFARANGYKRIILQTSPEQVRAIAFYQKLDFQEIDCYNDQTGEISMELKL